MAVEVVAPAVMGDAADMLGRRPVVLICLFVYLGSNIGCALVRSWHDLLGAKILQALGTSGEYSLGRL